MIPRHHSFFERLSYPYSAATLWPMGLLVGLTVVGCGGSPTLSTTPVHTEPGVTPATPPVVKPPGTTNQPTNEPAAFSLPAEDFYAEYKTDEKAALQKYKGKTIELSGVVKDTWGDYEGIVGLTAGKEPVGIPCIMTEREPWARLSPGQTVKLKGVMPATAKELRLRDCTVVDAGPNPAIIATADGIVREYTADPEGAKKKYDGKYLILSGDVANVKRNNNGTYAITLKGTDKMHIEFSYGSAYENDATKFKEGQAAKVLAKFSEFDCHKDYINFTNPQPITK